MYLLLPLVLLPSGALRKFQLHSTLCFRHRADTEAMWRNFCYLFIYLFWTRHPGQNRWRWHNYSVVGDSRGQSPPPHTHKRADFHLPRCAVTLRLIWMDWKMLRFNIQTYVHFLLTFKQQPILHCHMGKSYLLLVLLSLLHKCTYLFMCCTFAVHNPERLYQSLVLALEL